MKQQKRNEDAVSPVIGIMLMLVVTIIIAAVVTGFATDLSKDTDKTPIALFEVKDVKLKEYAGVDVTYTYLESFGLKHKGGDPIRLQDVQLTLEQVGGIGNNGITTTLSGAGIATTTPGERYYPLTVRGQETEKSKAVITTSDVILVELLKGTTGYSKAHIHEGSVAKWTLTHTKTGKLIASGEFNVIEN